MGPRRDRGREGEREHWGVKWRLKRKRPKFGDYLPSLPPCEWSWREGGHYTLSFFPLSARSRSSPDRTPVESSIMGHQTLNSSFEEERERERDRPFKRRLREERRVSAAAAAPLFRADGAVRNRRCRRGSRRSRRSRQRPPVRRRCRRRRYHLNPPTAAAAAVAAITAI